MTKKLKAIIITCCIGVLTMASYLVVSTIIANQSSSDSTFVTITSMAASDVASIKVTLRNGEYYYVTEDASVAATSSSVTYKTTFNGIYEGLPHDASRAKSLVSNCVMLSATRDLGEVSESEYAAYGFDDPLSTVVITKTDGKQLTYYIGSKNTSGMYYFMHNDDNHVYTLTSGTGGTFVRTPNDMRVTTLPLLATLENVVSMTVQDGDNDPITFVQDEVSSVYNPFCTYYTISPWKQKRPSNPDAIAALVESISTITVEGFVTPLTDGIEANLADYGLDKPWGYVRQELSDGTVYEYSFGNYTEDIVDYYCYLLDHSNNQIYIIVHDKVTFVSKYNAVQLTTPYILNAFMSEMRYIDIEFNGEKHTMESRRTYLTEEEIKEYEDAGTEYSLYTSEYMMDGVKYSESALSALYMCMTGARVQNVNTGYEHEETPLLTLTYRPFDASEPVTTVEFYKVNNNFCAVYVNGVTDFLSSYSTVKSIIDGVGIVQKGEVPPYVL